MEMVKTAAVGIAAVLLALQFKTDKTGIWHVYRSGGRPSHLWHGGQPSCAVTEGIETIASLISVDSKYIAILLKVTGIAYICEFTANLLQGQRILFGSFSD